jgi:predicted dehydrogenase
MAGAVATAVTPAFARKGNKMLRVAQIGMQGHFGYIMHGIPHVEHCQLVAVSGSVPGEKVERKKGWPAWTDATQVFDDWQKMLDKVKPDVVATFMPYALNGEVNIEAVQRGCHVISEKPIAPDMEQLDALRAARDKAGVHVTALLPMREHPQFAAARQAVRDGLIGEPVLISAQKSYRWGDNRPEFYRHRKTYGGSILWVAIHAIDFIRSVSNLDYASVTARHAVKVHKDYPGCEDCGALLFEMSNGGQATLTFDFLRPAKAPSHGDDRLRVVGSKGIVEVIAAKAPRCELSTNEAEPRVLEGVQSGVKVFEDFAALVRGEKRSYYLNAEDPFRANEVAIKARDAADNETTVKL